MSLPTFSAGSDPGSSFSELLRRSGVGPDVELSQLSQAGDGRAGWRLNDADLHLSPHGTTIVAFRYADGVVLAGDRRATAGVAIAARNMQKVFPADRHSGVAISGAAGRAVEMVKLFQLELEHYEKVQGMPLSLEGKANRLASMVRGNLPRVMTMGMVVIPLFAGYDTTRKIGRIFQYDLTGGRYEEAEFYATGSGGRHASALIKHRWRDGFDRVTSVDLALESLYEAADEDAATGGPDSMRGIYPTVATITAKGYEEVEESEVAARFAGVLAARQTAINEGGARR